MITISNKTGNACCTLWSTSSFCEQAGLIFVQNASDCTVVRVFFFFYHIGQRLQSRVRGLQEVSASFCLYGLLAKESKVCLG
jgi:hypothetical protein